MSVETRSLCTKRREEHSFDSHHRPLRTIGTANGVSPVKRACAVGALQTLRAGASSDLVDIGAAASKAPGYYSTPAKIFRFGNGVLIGYKPFLINTELRGDRTGFWQGKATSSRVPEVAPPKHSQRSVVSFRQACVNQRQ